MYMYGEGEGWWLEAPVPCPVQCKRHHLIRPAALSAVEQLSGGPWPRTAEVPGPLVPPELLDSSIHRESTGKEANAPPRGSTSDCMQSGPVLFKKFYLRSDLLLIHARLA